MRQMLYFYDAYKYNRSQYDNTKTCDEEHWRRHFKQVDDFGYNILCESLRKTINSAIRAHVKFDLARAIRYAFKKRYNLNITADTLKNEFLSTNAIFTLAQEEALADLKIHHSICTIADPEWKIWMGASIRIEEIIDWRENAFTQAILSNSPLQGYNGPLTQQPTFFPHKDYLEKAQTACSINYGLTIITHGLQPLGGSSTIENGVMYKIASAILERAGKGKILRYNKATGLYHTVKSIGTGGECILLFDWATESNNNVKGYSEAAGDALFASLILGFKNSNFDLRDIHFIGHSRGTVVNTLAVERLIILKQKVSNAIWKYFNRPSDELRST